jgi:hypothetical protein
MKTKATIGRTFDEYMSLSFFLNVHTSIRYLRFSSALQSNWLVSGRLLIFIVNYN